MVYAANGAFSVDGTVYGARFKHPQRAAEAAAHQALLRRRARGRFADPVHVNEGEGDFAYLPGAYGGLILAGYGFRTDPAAHAEAQEVLGRPVISLKLVDPALLPPGHRAGRARRPARHLLPGGVLAGLPAGPARSSSRTR